MSNLPDREWQSIYESKPDDGQDRGYLIKNFYEPALARSTRYDRIAGYFSSTALAAAATGIHALVENEGDMRLIVGTELYETDRPVLEALTDKLEASLEDLDDDQLNANLRILARLLRNNRILIKVAYPRDPSHDWEIFHPKVGIFHDNDGNALSFEGSVNETVGGWARNYERFKVHRSWIPEQAAYVDGDKATFERLWTDQHPYVKVYDLPDAIEQDIIDWKAPESDAELQEAIDIAQGTAPPTERDKACIVRDGPLAPGGVALAEQASTITPWPHQRVVSDTLINTYPQSFLLCDEVGLGKTIEAGLTLARLGITQELDTGLLLVPASLQRQWQEELWEKFNLNAYRFDRDTTGEYVFRDIHGRDTTPPSVADLDLDGDPAWASSPIWRFLYEHRSGQADEDPSGKLDGPTLIIMSWHTARLDDRWSQIAPLENESGQTRASVPVSCRGRDYSSEERMGVWDAVIVDEAHNARRGSNFYGLLDRLREYTQTYYLLTATPMQLHSGELYDLMQLLDLPDEWDDRNAFVEFFETRDALSHVLDDITEPSQSDEETDAAWETQATLDLEHQDRLPTDQPFSATVFQRLADELELNTDGQDRAVAKQRVLDACRLARSYGGAYDGYLDQVDAAINEYDIDHFEANEDTKLKRLLYPDEADEWLMASRSDRLDALDELSPAGWRVVQDTFAESTPVDALIHRNTRDTLRKYEAVGLLETTVPDRNPEQRKIELTDETRAVYDQIDDYTREFYKRAQQMDEAQTRAIGFVMTTYRQRLTSSVYAISQSLQHRLETLRAQRAVLEGRQRAREREYDEAEQVVLETLRDADLTDEDVLDELNESSDELDLSELVPSVTDEGKQLIEEEITALEEFVADLNRIDTDPKIQQLYADLDELDRAGHNRMIVFTQYADTMDFIRDSLVDVLGSTVATYSGRGGELYDTDTGAWKSVGKERVKREFSQDDGQVDVLVCTDSASEGLNLQECGALINYDLPWNPMRVEQRIGRIDRIGQRYDEVTILNYSYEDTVETDIYDRLDDRINLFENVVGEMQPVLSGVSSQIRAATLESDHETSAKAVESADEEFTKQIEDQGRRDRVDVGESLETVDTLLEQEVIDEAKLEAWQSFNHPDLVDVGDETYAYTPPFQIEAIEAILVENDVLADSGIDFTPVDEIDDLSSELTAEFEFGDATYRLTWDEVTGATDPDEGTLAAAIAPREGEVAVTFSRTCTDAYPSVRYLAPGDSLLQQLIHQLHAASDDKQRLTKYAAYRSANTDSPVICGWGRNSQLATLTDSDGVAEEHEPAELTTWRDTFLRNRENTQKE